jgi:ribosomal protein S18 acetylase RimI-like enzyme
MQSSTDNAPLSALSAALRRRRAARALGETRAAAVVAVEAAAAVAAASASTVILSTLSANSELTVAVLNLNDERLPGKVCREGLAARLQSNRASCLIALDKHEASRVMGFLLVEISRGAADVVLLAVAEYSVQQGIGRALLSKALAHAAVLECSSASLSVTSENTPARRLYSSMGFQLVQGRADVNASTMQWCLC